MTALMWTVRIAAAVIVPYAIGSLPLPRFWWAMLAIWLYAGVVAYDAYWLGRKDDDR